MMNLNLRMAWSSEDLTLLLERKAEKPIELLSRHHRPHFFHIWVQLFRAQGASGPKKEITTTRNFRNAMTEYLEELKEDERNKSEKLYRLACNSFIRECGDLFLTMITPRDIKKFRKNLEKRRLSPHDRTYLHDISQSSRTFCREKENVQV